MTTATLPVRPTWPLVTPLDPLHRVWDHVPQEPDFHLTADTPMLDLPIVALATMELAAPPAHTWKPTTRGRITEASLRATIWRDRGYIMSGYQMALELQAFFYGDTGNRRDRRRPLLGLDMLRAIDALGLAKLWVAIPRSPHSRRLVRVRLGEALDRGCDSVTATR